MAGTTTATATITATTAGSCCSSRPTACARTRSSSYADDGVMPGFRDLLKHGAYASDHGLLTQAPPNTGAGWFTLTTGAWPGVHGSTNNTFHINGAAFAQLDGRVREPEHPAGRDARPGGRARRQEGRPDRVGRRPQRLINGPTLDFRNFRSGRGVATNYIRQPPDNLLVRRPSCRRAVRPRRPGRRDRLDRRRRRPTRPPRRCACACSTARDVDKYGLNAYIYDSKNDRKTRYDRVLFSRTKSGADKVADLKEGEWADVKVKIAGRRPRRQDRRVPDQGRAPRPRPQRTSGCSTRASRARSRSGRTGPASTATPARSRTTWPSKFPSSQAGDFAVLEAGIVSEDTYIQQGQYWEKLYHPLIKYVLSKYKPDLALVGYPGTDEVQHQFLGLVTKKLPNGAKNPAYDDIEVNGTPDHRVSEREEYIKEAYEGSDATMRLAQQYMNDRDLNTFVSSDHGFAAAVRGDRRVQGAGRPRPAVSTPQTGNCRPAATETIGSAKACWAGGAVQIYLNLAGRDPAPVAPSTFKQIPATDEAATVDEDQGRVPRDQGPQRLDRRRPARGLEGHRPRLHQGRGALHPERREHDGRHVAPDAYG